MFNSKNKPSFPPLQDFIQAESDLYKKLLLEALQLLIALKSTAHQTITHIEGLRSIRFRLRSRKLAAQILAMASCQIAMKAIERT